MTATGWLAGVIADLVWVPSLGMSWPFFLLIAGLGFASLVYSVFWIGMLIHCVCYEPDKTFWLWLLVVAPFPGAIVYAFVRFVPAADWRTPSWLQKFTRGKELARLATATETIGNAHQFVQYGDALRETGQWSEAATAYEQALKKDPENLPALWGAAQVAVTQKRPADVCRLCQQILEREPHYRFGDVSFTYAKALFAAGETSNGFAQLERHCQRWRQPEAVYLLAEHCFENGDHAASRQHLQELLRDINGSPAAIASQNGRWKSRARKLLKKIP